MIAVFLRGYVFTISLPMTTTYLNKLSMAILFGLLSAALSAFIANTLIQPKSPEKLAYPLPTRDAVQETQATQAAEIPPIAARLALANIDNGRNAAQTCTACHSFSEGGAVGVGPALWDIVGSSFTHDSRFNYSNAFDSRASEQWTYETLDAFLANPQRYIPGTRMSYIGISDPQDRADLIGWLRELSDNPKPLP